MFNKHYGTITGNRNFRSQELSLPGMELLLPGA